MISDIKAIAEIVFWVSMPILILALPLITKLIAKQLKKKGWDDEFEEAINTAYLVVHQLSRKTENKVDDKIAEALKVMVDALGRELTEVEKKKATVELKAKHEIQKNPHLAVIIKDKAVGMLKGLFGKDD